MAETAAHLVDHVFPHVPVRQFVLSLPKRLRGPSSTTGPGPRAPSSTSFSAPSRPP